MQPSILTRLLAGFFIFIDAARLLVQTRMLWRLAIGGALVQIAWLGMVLLLLQGVSHGRLVGLGAGIPTIVQILVLVLGGLLLLFGVPVIGPIAATLQVRAAECVRAHMEHRAPADRDVDWWAGSILTQSFARYRRAFIQGCWMLLAAGFTSELVADRSAPLQALAPLSAAVIVFAIGTLLQTEREVGGKITLLRSHWPDMVGYATGACLLSLFGLGPWLVILLAVAAELFRARLPGRDAGKPCPLSASPAAAPRPQ